MDAGLVFAVVLAVAFAVTNGFLDAANSIAALVARPGAATPLQAIVLASVFNLLGPLLLGAAVANTIGGIVSVRPSAGQSCDRRRAWRGGDLEPRRVVAQASFELRAGARRGSGGGGPGRGGRRRRQLGWGAGRASVGAFGTLISLAISPPLGALAALLMIRLLRRLGRRATRRWRTPVRGGQWATAAALAFSHGANDAQKSVGVIAALLLAGGRISTLAAPTWVTVACAVAVTAGTALGGWRIIRTVGRRIYRIQPVEGLASTAASAAVIFGASLVGAPVSTSQVVASSVVGIGGGRWRWHHVHWEVVRQMGLAWLITLPVTGVLAAVIFELSGWLT